MYCIHVVVHGPTGPNEKQLKHLEHNLSSGITFSKYQLAVQVQDCKLDKACPIKLFIVLFCVFDF